MSDESKNETPADAAGNRPKRPPPTIDLEASEVTADTNSAPDADAVPGAGVASKAGPGGRAVPWLTAVIGGAVAAAAVLAGLWASGLLGRAEPVQTAAVTPTHLDSIAADVEGLKAQLARVEAAPPTTQDATLAGRVEALDASAASLRDEIAQASTQLRTFASSLDELKSTSRDAVSPSAVDRLNERMTQLEQSMKAFSAERVRPGAAAEDAAVRRLVVANTLEAAVRAGEPFVSSLAAAKQVASDPAALAPLDAFAAKGIAPAATYLRRIVPVLQRLADTGTSRQDGAAGSEKSGVGVFDRLQAGLAKLVRIERDDAKSAPNAASPSPAALAGTVRRDDLAAARQDVARLPQAGDPQIQAWIKSVDEREAALAASARFSAEALAALGKSGQ